MIGHRRADDLDRLLDRLVAVGGPEATGDPAPYLHPARVARAALFLTVPEGLAIEHLAALRSERGRNVVVMPSARRRGVRVTAAALLAAVVVLLGAGSAVAASANTLPGDALYGVKRTVERISLAMHRDPIERAELHLQFAQARLNELTQLITDGRDAGDTLEAMSGELIAAEQDARHAVALGRDADALLAHVQEMIANHIYVLNGVLERVPEQAQDAIRRAIDNANKAKDKVQHGRPPGSGKPTSAPGGRGNAPGRP